MPINAHGRASQTNLISISTASFTMWWTFCHGNCFLNELQKTKTQSFPVLHFSLFSNKRKQNISLPHIDYTLGPGDQIWKSELKQKQNHLYSRQAKSQWRPSSLEISSFENVKPGMSPLFLSQNMAQKLWRNQITNMSGTSSQTSANHPYWKIWKRWWIKRSIPPWEKYSFNTCKSNKSFCKWSGAA